MNPKALGLQDANTREQSLETGDAKLREVLAAARKIEAHSYHSKFGDRNDHYVVDTEAMDDLCRAIGKCRNYKP